MGGAQRLKSGTNLSAAKWDSGTEVTKAGVFRQIRDGWDVCYRTDTGNQCF